MKQKTIEKKYVLVQLFSSFLFYLLTPSKLAELPLSSRSHRSRTKKTNGETENSGGEREKERVFFQSLKFRRGSSGALGLGGARGGFKASRRSLSAAAMAGRAAIDTTP